MPTMKNRPGREFNPFYAIQNIKGEGEECLKRLNPTPALDERKNRWPNCFTVRQFGATSLPRG
jgi:hypothetical protein